MSKRVKNRFETIQKLEKHLRTIFGELNAPVHFTQYRNNRPWQYTGAVLEISNLPDTFEVIHIVPSSAGIKRVITPVDFSLVEFAEITEKRKKYMRKHGPAFYSLMLKLIEKNIETEFSHMLIISAGDKRVKLYDKVNIRDAMTLFGRRRDTISSTFSGQTAIAFKTENDAMAFRLGYPGSRGVKMVDISE